MSLVSNLAVAPAYAESVRADSLDLPRPWALPTDTFADLWEHLASGRLRPMHEQTSRDRVCFVGRIAHASHSDACAGESLARRVLCGDARKVLADELGIAVSTVTGRYLRTLERLGLRECTMPLVLVLAAQSRKGLARIPSTRSTYIDPNGWRCLSVSVPRPVTSCLTALTPVQQQVAQWLIEGATREMIAELRGTAVNTVAGQVHAVFHALRVTGRYELTGRAWELGCFNRPAVSVV